MDSQAALCTRRRIMCAIWGRESPSTFSHHIHHVRNRYITAIFTESTILDKSPWDSLKIWHAFADRSVFDALEGRVCAKWRPPSPLVNVASKKCTFSPLIQHWEGEGGGGNRRGAIFSEKVQVSQHFCPGLSELNDQNKNVDNFSMIYRIAAKFGLVNLRDFVRLLSM